MSEANIAASPQKPSESISMPFFAAMSVATARIVVQNFLLLKRSFQASIMGRSLARLLDTTKISSSERRSVYG